MPWQEWCHVKFWLTITAVLLPVIWRPSVLAGHAGGLCHKWNSAVTCCMLVHLLTWYKTAACTFFVNVDRKYCVPPVKFLPCLQIRISGDIDRYIWCQSCNLMLLFWQSWLVCRYMRVDNHGHCLCGIILFCNDALELDTGYAYCWKCKYLGSEATCSHGVLLGWDYSCDIPSSRM